MREYLVSRDERGQRLDKYLKRRLPGAPSSFIYKMLRKKNITLRGKKADGSEKVEEGDPVVLYLSDETIEKFSDRGSSSGQQKDADEDERAFRRLQPLLGQNPVLYEDEDVLIVIKPAGVLSQKSAPGDLSMNEWLRGYLGQKRKGSDHDRLDTASGFRPSVCNRLDRDHARTPMQWNGGPNAGFSNGKDTWIKVNPRFLERTNVEKEEADETSILSFYRRLIKERENRDALHDGKFTPIRTKGPIIAFIRENENEKYLTLINLSKKKAKIPESACMGASDLVLSTYEEKELKGLAYLRPYEGLLLKIG